MWTRYISADDERFIDHRFSLGPATYWLSSYVSSPPARVSRCISLHKMENRAQPRTATVISSFTWSSHMTIEVEIHLLPMIYYSPALTCFPFFHSTLLVLYLIQTHKLWHSLSSYCLRTIPTHIYNYISSSTKSNGSSRW